MFLSLPFVGRCCRRLLSYSTSFLFSFFYPFLISSGCNHDGDAPGLRHSRQVIEVGLGAIRIRNHPRHHHWQRTRQNG